MPYIVSTMSNDNTYIDYDKGDKTKQLAGPATPKMSVLIKGGANISGNLVTPDGVITHVSDAELNFLRSNDVFKTQINAGNIKVFENEVAPAEAAKDMTGRDDSAQLDESKGDFKEGGRAAGVAPKNAKVK